MKISKLVFQKRSERVNVYLDEVFAFGLNTEVVLQNRLKINQELGENDIFEPLFASHRFELTSQTLLLIGRRPHSIWEVKTYLKKRILAYKKKQINNFTENFYAKILADSDTLINQIVDKMVANGFLDDLEFAKWWVEQRIGSRPRGVFALQAELTQKGVKREQINRVLGDQTLISRDATNKMMDKILAKAWKSIQHRGYDTYKLKQILASRLLSKGFSWDEIRGKIDDFVIEVVQSSLQKK